MPDIVGEDKMKDPSKKFNHDARITFKRREPSQDRPRQAMLVLGSMVVLLLINLMAKDKLFEDSLWIIQRFRANYACRSLDIFFSITSELGDKYVLIFYAIWAQTNLDLGRAFHLVVTISFSVSLLAILKVIEGSPRPFYVVDNLHLPKCWVEYGSPSGHALVTSNLLLSLWLVLKKTEGWNSPTQTVRNAVIFSILVLAVACSRIGLGVHSIDQIFSGWIWGFSLAYITAELYFFEIASFPFWARQQKGLALWWNTGTKMFLGWSAVSILYFIVVQSFREPHEDWIINMRKNCVKVKENKTFEMEGFEKNMTALALVGIYIGVIIEHKIMGTSKYAETFQGNKLWQTVLRALMIFVCGIPQLVLYLKLPKDSMNYFLLLFLRYFLPGLIGNTYLFGVQKWQSLKYGICNSSEGHEQAELANNYKQFITIVRSDQDDKED